MTRPIKNQRGLALVTTMMLLVLGFAVVAILLRLTTRQAKLTGIEQGYTTALGAAKAGTDDFIYNTQLCLNNNPLGQASPCTNPAQGFGTLTGSGATEGCLYMKLFNNTVTSSSVQWDNTPGWDTSLCGDQAQAISTDSSDVQQFPDITVPMGNYTVFIKIVNTYSSPPPHQATDPCYPNGCYYYTVTSLAVGNGSNGQAQAQFIYRFTK